MYSISGVHLGVVIFLFRSLHGCRYATSPSWTIDLVMSLSLAFLLSLERASPTMSSCGHEIPNIPYDNYSSRIQRIGCRNYPLRHPQLTLCSAIGTTRNDFNRLALGAVILFNAGISITYFSGCLSVTVMDLVCYVLDLTLVFFPEALPSKLLASNLSSF